MPVYASKARTGLSRELKQKTIPPLRYLNWECLLAFLQQYDAMTALITVLEE